MLGTRFGTSPTLDRDQEDNCRVVLIGTWRAMRGDETIRCQDVTFVHCTEPDRLPAVVNATKAGWILAGHDLDDGDIQRTVSGAKALREDLRLAILGQRHDWRRCERWVRRGCRVYLDDSIGLRRAAYAIHTAQTLEVNVVDRVFHQTLQDRAVGPMPHLTRREREVLDLVRRGLRNRDIAGILHVTENTVEYHMRHLLSKFSARSRLEVVERATALGLA